MKVLVIHTSYQYKGGEDTVVAEEIKLLQSSGVEVELLSFNNDRGALLKLVQLPFNVQSYYQTKKKLTFFKPDVVHIHNLHFGASASVIYTLKKSKLPFVITVHNYRLLCPSGILFHNGAPFLASLDQRFPWEAVRKGVYKDSRLITFWLAFSMYLHNKSGIWKACSRYIVLSEHARNIFLKSKLGLTPAQIVVKPNFCYPPQLKPQKRADHFLYVGRLSEEKGLMLLLEVFSSSRYEIKIAGNGPLKQEVERYSAQYPNIEYLGIVDQNSVYSLLQSCGALVFPSIWFEGMPLTIIEAFACGTPVISSEIGAMQTMINHDFNGLHFKPQNKEDFKKQLLRWYNLSADEKARFSANALKTYQEKYTPERNLQQLLNVYNTAILENSQKQKTEHFN